MITFNSLLKTKPAWLCAPADEEDIVMGGIVRLVRNLPGLPFPGWSTEETRARSAEQLLPLIHELKGMKTAWSAEMSSLSYEQRMCLLVRKMLSPAMAARQDGCHLVIPNKQNMLFMVNEEEHLVIHAYDEGAQFERTFRKLAPVVKELEQRITFARTRQHGYLTSIPTEAGSGIQLYAMMHLPALTMSNMMSQVTKGLEALKLCLSPGFSDGEDDTGNCYILFTRPTQDDWRAQAAHFTDIISRLADRERQARKKLLMAPGMYLMDAISRSFGVVRTAMRMSLREIRNTLSMIRLGVSLDLIQEEGLDKKALLEKLHKLHLDAATLTAQTEPNSDELPVRRAKLINKALSKITFSHPPLNP